MDNLDQPLARQKTVGSSSGHPSSSQPKASLQNEDASMRSSDADVEFEEFKPVQTSDNSNNENFMGQLFSLHGRGFMINIALLYLNEGFIFIFMSCLSNVYQAYYKLEPA